MSGRLAFVSNAAGGAGECGVAVAAFRSICRMRSGCLGRSISASCTLVGKCKLTVVPDIAAAAASASTGRTDCGLVVEHVGLAYARRLAIDKEHRRTRATRIDRAMQAVG